MKILVTGASGFVGGHLARGLAGAGFDVTAIGGRRPISEEVRSTVTASASLNLSDRAAVENLLLTERPEVIVHSAALASSAECESNPAEAKAANITATENLSRLSKHPALKVRLFIYISTDLVFDGGEAPLDGFRETDIPSPLSIYGKTKLEGERISLKETLNPLVLRLALVYGEKIGNAAGFLGWVYDGLSGGTPLRLFVDEWRNPIFVDDIVTAVEGLIARAKENRAPAGIFNIGGSERISRYDFGLRLCDVCGFDSKLLVPSKRPSTGIGSSTTVHRPSDVCLNIDKVRELSGLRFSDVHEGLARLRARLP